MDDETKVYQEISEEWDVRFIISIVHWRLLHNRDEAPSEEAREQVAVEGDEEDEEGGNVQSAQAIGIRMVVGASQ